jgi:hypothetical protein
MEVHGMKNCRWAGWLTGGVNGDPMDGMYLSAWEIAREPVDNAPTVVWVFHPFIFEQNKIFIINLTPLLRCGTP